MKIGLTYNIRSNKNLLNEKTWEEAEFDMPETINFLEEGIMSLGHKVVRIGNIENLVKFLSENNRVDLVFNIAEGKHGRNREAQIPALLEAYDIPYTFSDPLTLALCLDKAMTKRVVQSAGIKTALFWECESEESLKEISQNENLLFPLFIKPVHEGTGIGVSPKSIIQNKVELKTFTKKMLEEYDQPVLIEEYLPGGEITVGVLGTGNDARVIGVLGIRLKEGAEEGVYSLTNKEECEKLVEYYLITDTKIIDFVSPVALTIHRVLGCRDASRIDFREDKNGQYVFLEINPLSGIHPAHSDLPILCNFCGINYKKLLNTIIESAKQRIPNKF